MKDYAQQIIDHGGLKQSLHPLKRHNIRHGYVLGFDTEFEGSQLYSVQLSYRGVGKFYRRSSITAQELYELSRDLIQEVDGKVGHWGIYLWAFWNEAEVSHIKGVLQDVILQAGPGRTWTGRYKPEGEKRYRLYFRDIYPHFQASLKNTAKLFGQEKLYWDFENIPTSQAIHDPAFERYAVNDAVIIEAIVNRFREEVMGAYGADIMINATPAQLSMAIYRKSYLTTDIEQHNIDLRRLALKAPHGARAEAYRITGEGMNEWDFSGLYPNSVIALERLPREDDWRQFTPGELKTIDPDIISGIFLVEFRHPPDTEFPALPVQSGKHGIWIYPLEGRSYCTWSEIKQAFSLGCKINVISGWFYQDGITSYAQFMGEMMRLKDLHDKTGEDPDPIRRTMAKNNANHGIGKLYQHKGGLDLAKLRKISDDTGIPLEDLFEAGEILWQGRRIRIDRINRIIVSKSSWAPEWHTLILGFARAELHKLLMASEDPVASSTDAVIARRIRDQGQFKVQYVGKYDQPMYYHGHRTKLYTLISEEGRKAWEEGRLRDWLEDPGNKGKWKSAHHAVHLRDMEAMMLQLQEGQKIIYKARKIGTLAGQLQKRRAPDGDPVEWGANYRQDMILWKRWDQKRKLREDGSSEPWQNVGEFDQARSEENHYRLHGKV
jgi:hypothetical protein